MKSKVGATLAHKPGSTKPYVVGVEIVNKQTLMGFSGGKMDPFLKIFSSLPKHIPLMRGILEGDPFWGGRVFSTFESDILFVMRFMIDADLMGCSWVRFNPGKYVLIPPHVGQLLPGQKSNRASNCQIEISAWY